MLLVDSKKSGLSDSDAPKTLPGSLDFINNDKYFENRDRIRREEIMALIEEAMANNVPPENMARNDAEYQQILKLLSEGQDQGPKPAKATISSSVLIGSVAALAIGGMILANSVR